MGLWSRSRVNNAERLVAGLDEAGCEVEAIVSSHDLDYKVRAWLRKPGRNGGITFRAASSDFDGDGTIDRYLHEKVVMVNGGYGTQTNAVLTFMGTHNFTYNAFRGNNDVILRIADRAIHARWEGAGRAASSAQRRCSPTVERCTRGPDPAIGGPDPEPREPRFAEGVRRLSLVSPRVRSALGVASAPGSSRADRAVADSDLCPSNWFDVSWVMRQSGSPPRHRHSSGWPATRCAGSCSPRWPTATTGSASWWPSSRSRRTCSPTTCDSFATEDWSLPGAAATTGATPTTTSMSAAVLTHLPKPRLPCTRLSTRKTWPHRPADRGLVPSPCFSCVPATASAHPSRKPC